MLAKVELKKSGDDLERKLMLHGPFMSFYQKISCLYEKCRTPLDVENHTEATTAVNTGTHYGILKCPACQGVHEVTVNDNWGTFVAPTIDRREAAVICRR